MFTNSFPRHTNTVTTGLIAGTLVEGSQGWMPVEDLRIGDALQSYDGGLVRVLGLDRQWTAPKMGDFAILVPGGAMDNCSDLTLLAGQTLLIDTLGDDTLSDAIVALIPAAAVEGWLGAHRVSLDRSVEVITPRFADDEAIYANSGTLLHCPGIKQDVGAATSDFFTRLDFGQAQALLTRLYGRPIHHPLRRAA